MDKKTLKEKLKTFIESLNYELYDVEIRKSKKQTILTVYIDHINGITIDDCVAVTQEINPYMDELDPIQGEYMLEVSSAGAEKELRSEKAIKHAIGKYVHIETYEQKLEGNLVDFDGFEITVKIRNKTFKINYEEVNLIRLAIKF